MKIVSVLKRNRLIFLVLVVYSILLFTSPDKAIQSWKNGTYYLIEMLQVLPVIFLLTVVIEVLVPKEMITKGFGEAIACSRDAVHSLNGTGSEVAEPSKMTVSWVWHSAAQLRISSKLA